ncbi:MAG: EpsD family peptidyl-prolyl cis-trans isomerase [Sphingomonas sp.]|uniref:EpsD family peptidyl-prolyl cis-trans isomerase n=1 Tax=Sphingomonas sp. TaxID=28214 RepID=UPI001AC2EB5E|nr:EpsD family peptidyl-prolyl cis-trans isomerase [Sphingomonas sp.]MBN8808853.1 EpsD family peptidyl-prolyl cis-trans isomerase [Sphingomonas sp.]
MTRITLGRLLSTGSRRGILVTMGAAVLLAGCHSKPTGQVVATVNGDEITQTELNAELGNMQAGGANADKAALQKAALERIVERKLLAGAARQDGIDQSPEFIVKRKQLEDALLVQMLAQKIAGGIKTPATGDVDKFISDNSNMFAGRTIFAVDQLQFDTPKRDDYVKELTNAHTMEAVIAVLDKLGIKYQRQNTQVDSAMVPPQMLTQITKLPAGEPFVVPTPGKITVSVITGTKPAPLAGDVARPLAANAVRNNELGKALQQRLTAERGKAQIQYQPGFSAPAGAPGTAATGTPAK